MKTKTDISATVLRALEVLDHLKEMPGPQSITNISKDLDISSTIVHRLLATLKMKGFVFQDTQSKLYSLGAVFMEYANKVVTELPFAQIIEPWLNQLRDTTGETVGFYIPNGHTRLCVMEYESRQQIRRSVGIGTQHPIYAGATGRAILSFQPSSTQDDILSSFSTSERIKITKQLEETRNQGYAISYEEINDNVTAISAPVYDQNKHVIGAISISGPDFRFTEDQTEASINSLLHATEKIAKAF